MRRFAWFAVLTASLFSGHLVSAQSWADVEITFIYDGDKVPERSSIDMSKDPLCTFKKLDDKMVVNPKNKGIQHVGLWVDKKKSMLADKDIHPDLQTIPTKSLLLDNNQCVFVPHFIVARAGQTIEVKNSDTTGHNANFNFLNNQPQNFIVPAMSSKNLTLAKGMEEPAPIPVQCNVHPWMEAKLMVVDHPYGGVSDENGVLKMEKVPAGRKLTMRLFHENQAKAIDEVDVDGKSLKLSRGYAELEFKPGENKLKVKISAKKFK